MIIFIVPVYNEAQNIVNLLARTHHEMERSGLAYKIIVVNDGSTDATEKKVESLAGKFNIELCSYYPNKGVGEAFRVGFRRAIAIAGDSDIIVTKEGDNTSDLRILSKLISRINDGYDLVLASCYAKEGAVLDAPLLRRILSRAANMLLAFCIGIKGVHTYSSFYRAYSTRSMKEMFSIYDGRLIEQDGFECMVELLIKFGRHKKFKIAEVPMTLDGSRRVGRSKMRILKTIKGFVRVILKHAVLYRLKQIFKKNRSEGSHELK